MSADYKTLTALAALDHPALVGLVAELAEALRGLIAVWQNCPGTGGTPEARAAGKRAESALAKLQEARS